ncbi:MAG: methyltransferase domain-containing protein [Hoeflea sp.]|uniref:methyltransferase domain-containing protein n=1 Tax=Hoeflea sp. TaxID=1940281 RepID=UPI003EF58003
MISNAKLREEMEALGPWHQKLKLREGIYTQSSQEQDKTGETVHIVDPLHGFNFATRAIFPDGLQGRSFLDCACNCGGYSFVAKDSGAGKVYGFDAREHWVRQARFIAEHRSADSSDIRFEVRTLDDLGKIDENFDVTWFSGIFYHLPDPVASLKLAADRTREVLFLNTACVSLDDGEPEIPELVFRPEGIEQLMSGVDGISWLPSGPEVLKKILKWIGFAEVKTYLWMQDTSVTGVQSSLRMGRIAVAAAREPGMLANVQDLQKPNAALRSRSQDSTSETKPKQLDAAAQTQPPTQGPKRPLRWEDDLSSNALDTAPFELISPVSEWRDDEFVSVYSNRGPGEIRDLPAIELAKRDTAPLPIARDREGYCGENHEWYWLSGLRDYHLTQKVFDRHGAKVRRLLDIGCASGRVTRHFAFQSDIPEIWGSDINHRHIRFMNTYMPPHVRAVAMPCLPHYPVEDNYFDAITAFSVFTHIDVFETGFLAEIRRALKPGGLAYLTISDESHWNVLRGTLDDVGPNLAKRIASYDSDFESKLEQPLSFENRYYNHTDIGPYRGVIFTPRDHIYAVWSRFFTIEEIIPFGHAQQAVVVLRK